MSKKMSKSKIMSLIGERIINMSIPYIEEYNDKVTGIYLSPYKYGKSRHIQIVVVKDKEELPMLAQETSVKNTRIYLSINDISDYTIKKTLFTDYKYVKDLKSGYIIYDPQDKLDSRQNELNKTDIKCFSNRDELDTKMIDEVKTKLLTR